MPSDMSIATGMNAWPLCTAITSFIRSWRSSNPYISHV